MVKPCQLVYCTLTVKSCYNTLDNIAIFSIWNFQSFVVFKSLLWVFTKLLYNVKIELMWQWMILLLLFCILSAMAVLTNFLKVVLCTFAKIIFSTPCDHSSFVLHKFKLIFIGALIGGGTLCQFTFSGELHALSITMKVSFCRDQHSFSSYF